MTAIQYTRLKADFNERFTVAQKGEQIAKAVNIIFAFLLTSILAKNQW